MTLTSVLLFWQNLKTDVIKTLKRRSNNEDKDPEEQEKIENTRKITKTPAKYWNTTLTMNGNMIKIGFGDMVEDMITPGWVERLTSFRTYKNTLVLTSGHLANKHERKIVMVTTSKQDAVQSLADMPEAVSCPGIIRNENHIDIIGGYLLDTRKCSNVNRLCLQSNQWQECPAIRPNVVDPITCIGFGQITWTLKYCEYSSLYGCSCVCFVNTSFVYNAYYKH